MGIKRDKSPVTPAWLPRVYLWASFPAGKGKWGCRGRLEAELGRQRQDHQVEVDGDFGVQRQPPVERKNMRAPIVLDWSSVYEPIGYPLTRIWLLGQ